MTRHDWLKTLCISAAAAVALAGCAGDEEATYEQPATQETQRSSDFNTGRAGTVDDREAQQISEAERRRAAEQQRLEALRDERTIYFEFDSAELSNEAREIIRAHADYLVANPGVRVRLEGHTDERGTREYNIALGERRAKSVERAMLLRGVSRSQLRVVSYGEENPVDLGHNEAAWAKNRRVVVAYQ